MIGNFWPTLDFDYHIFQKVYTRIHKCSTKFHFKITFRVRALGAFHRNTCQSGPCPASIMLTTFVLEAKENLLTWFGIFISWLFCNQEEIGCGRKRYCCGTSFCVCTIMTSYTKRCTRTRRVCWCKFGWNPTRSFCVICNLVSLSLIQGQGLSLDFACLFIYSLVIGPELFVCLSIYENAEVLSPSVNLEQRWSGLSLLRVGLQG